MHLYILYTGGTIGCVGTPLAPMSGAEFEAAFLATMLPPIETQLPRTSVTFDSFEQTVDSTNMQPSDWVRMADRICRAWDEHDAFLVLHGTDTMAWTAAALSFLLPSVSKPVIVTGSQLPLFFATGSDPSAYQVLHNTDAVRNVEGAIRFLDRAIAEVGLYFADQLLRGNRAIKSHASQFIAFSSPNYQPLGELGVRPILHSDRLLQMDVQANAGGWLARAKQDLNRIATRIDAASAIPFVLFPAPWSTGADDPSLLVSILQHIQTVTPELRGIVFEAYGEGNIPDFPAMQEQVRLMHDAGIVMVDCTQAFAGNVGHANYRTGSWIADAGVIAGGDMTPVAALAKLIVLLAREDSPDAVRRGMKTNLAGELTVSG